MDWPYLVAIVLFGGVGILLVQRRRRQGRLTLTEQDLRCPVNDCRATLTVRTDSIAHPWRRYVDVATCSLLPPTAFVPPARTAHFSDVSPCESYLYDASQAPRYSPEVACRKHCLRVLNAAEDCDPARPIRCTSGVSDGLDLARQTQSPAITRLLWFHSV